MKRAVYDKQFKIAAVKLVQSDDDSVTKVANELNISGSSLRRWLNEYDEYGESAFPGHGNVLFNSTYEIKKLEKANCTSAIPIPSLVHSMLSKIPSLIHLIYCCALRY